jgi:hypothetical protein
MARVLRPIHDPTSHTNLRVLAIVASHVSSSGFIQPDILSAFSMVIICPS